jgi:hypothetical protein
MNTSLDSCFCQPPHRAALRSHGGSAVVEPQRMETDECLLPLRPGTRHCVRREVIHHRCGSDALGEITTSVVALDKHASRVIRPQWHPSVPDVRDKEGNVACLRHYGNRAASFPLQVIVCQVPSRGCLARCVATRNDPGRSGIDRTIPEEEVGRDRKHRVGNSRIPRNTGVARDMRSTVDVPVASEVSVVARLLPPRRVGNHMAVFP